MFVKHGGPDDPYWLSTYSTSEATDLAFGFNSPSENVNDICKIVVWKT
jgi:hypothetical protein